MNPASDGPTLDVWLGDGIRTVGMLLCRKGCLLIVWVLVDSKSGFPISPTICRSKPAPDVVAAAGRLSK